YSQAQAVDQVARPVADGDDQVVDLHVALGRGSARLGVLDPAGLAFGVERDAEATVLDFLPLLEGLDRAPAHGVHGNRIAGLGVETRDVRAAGGQADELTFQVDDGAAAHA